MSKQHSLNQDSTKPLNHLFCVGFTTQATKRPSETALSDGLPIFRLPFPRQPETFTPPQTHPPSFPRRRESWFGCSNIQINKRPPNPKQDSRLRGNDGVCCFSDGLFLFFNPSHSIKPNNLIFIHADADFLSGLRFVRIVVGMGIPN